MIFQHSSYRSFLKTTLVERSAHDRKFSLRSMASELGLGHSSLCEIMKGKKNLSPERAAKVAGHLKLSHIEAEYFCLLVSLDRTKDENLKSSIRDKIKGMNPNWSEIQKTDSLASQSMQEVVVSAETFSISPEQVPEAKKAIDGLFDTMKKLTNSEITTKQTYQLSVQLIGLSQCISVLQ